MKIGTGDKVQVVYSKGGKLWKTEGIVEVLMRDRLVLINIKRAKRMEIHRADVKKITVLSKKPSEP